MFTDTLESLERGEMVKDYNANSTSGNGTANGGAESEDEEDPRTPTSVSSQGSVGYDSTGSDFVDIEGFTTIPDTSLPELNLQVRGYSANVVLFSFLTFTFDRVVKRTVFNKCSVFSLC